MTVLLTARVLIATTSTGRARSFLDAFAESRPTTKSS